MTFPDCLEKIDLFAFFQTGLESVQLPPSLRTVAQGAFACCESLRSVQFGEELETLGTDEHSDDGMAYYGVFQKSALKKV